MQRKLTPQELAERALNLLNETDLLEEKKNWLKAIEKYQQAADYLKQSGYLPHRIADIYKRIEEIKYFLEQEKLYQKQTKIAQIEKFQNQAFAILDGAKKLENEGHFKDAITQYMSAIKLLVEAGWTETQLEDLKTKIMGLTKKVEEKTIIPPDSKDFKTIKETIEPEFEKKSEKLRAYEARRQKEEQIQNDAFKLIDLAKTFEKEKRFDNAIQNYQEAIKLLHSIGWTDQTRSLEVLTEKLRKDKINYERVETQRQKLAMEPLKDTSIELPTDIESEDKIRKQKLRQFEIQKQIEEETQTKAFNLIDFAKQLEREKKYEEAIVQFQNAIELLKSISWDSYIQPIYNFINDIKEKKNREIKAEQIKKKREEDLNQLQKTIHEKQKETYILSAHELESRRRNFEQEKLKQAEKENQFFNILANADNILQDGIDINRAIDEYQKALEMLQELGAGWESYYSTIEATISNIKQRKDYQLEQKLAILKKKDESNKRELEFQEQLDKLLERERKKIQQKELSLRAREEDLKYREQGKNKAFHFLEAGLNYLKQGDFDRAIYSYQNAGNIFAEIHWMDELPLIERSIKEIEEQKKESILAKQKKLKDAIENEKKERMFQTELKNQLQLEREKLKQKEIVLRLHQKELEYRENKKEEAYKLLELVQNYVTNGEYETAIDQYRQIANIFAEIQWPNEVNLIQKSIIEIENKKKEAQIQKQKEFQAALEKEREDRQFQDKISKAMQEQIDDFKQREIKLKVHEQELNLREQKKEQAFQLLDKAQNLLMLKKFDETLDIYYEVANLFAQIQWQDEIHIIQNAIKDIKAKKEEKDLWKQKSMQKALEEETQYRIFIDQLKNQRELEKAKLIEKQELLEKEKTFSAEFSAKQKQAFEITHEGDKLLQQEKFDEAITQYKMAASMLSEIGWEPNYLRLLQEHIGMIYNRKLEREKEREKQESLIQKRQTEEQEFQLRIAEQIRKEKEKMLVKKIEVKKREELKAIMEAQKIKAFNLMEQADSLLSEGQYDLSLEKYRQAELILNEIQFPTQVIKDTILKVEERKRNEIIQKQKDLEKRLVRNQEELLFNQMMVERLKTERQKFELKQIEIQQKEELRKHMEKRKEDAFKLLEEAEIFLNQYQYDKSLELYKSAELTLAEIQYPTNAIRDMIFKVKEKKNEYEIAKQKEIEMKIQKERVEYEFQKRIADNFKKEKERLIDKKLELEEKEQLKATLESRRQQAFEILDKAQTLTKSSKYDEAMEFYRKAELILNELHFPTDSIKEMISNILSLKEDRENLAESELQNELKQLEAQKQLDILIEERKRQEEEKKLAQKLALQEREKLIEEQKTQREAAYALLEEAGKYLKRFIPDYDKAISLYYQARKILAEKIGWEPEIRNLDNLIKDLQQEKANLIEKQRYEAQQQLKRQQEFEIFKEEMRRKKVDHEKQMEEQRSKLKSFEEQKHREGDLKEEGLNLIDEGKRNADLKNFDQAYKMFEKAIMIFREIRWNDQIHYIETEIKNTRNLEEKFKQDLIEREKLEDELERQRQAELEKWRQEDLKMRATIGEVGDLADEVSILIREREEKLKLLEKEKNQLLKVEAKEFSRDMGKMLKIKQELLLELERAKKEEKRRKEEQIKAKERKEVDEIAEMLRDLKKKKE